MVPRILIVESDVKALAMMESALSAAGYDVASTLHSKDTGRLFDDFSPQLLVAEIVMADGDAIDTIAALRRRHPKARILALANNDYLLQLAMKHGANFILRKPFGPGEIAAMVKTVLS